MQVRHSLGHMPDSGLALMFERVFHPQMARGEVEHLRENWLASVYFSFATPTITN
jgi:hypothetical protein